MNIFNRNKQLSPYVQRWKNYLHNCKCLGIKPMTQRKWVSIVKLYGPRKPN